MWTSTLNLFFHDLDDTCCCMWSDQIHATAIIQLRAPAAGSQPDQSKQMDNYTSCTFSPAPLPASSILSSHVVS
eukprot:scaffold33741_cov142-Skeletonema_dohrnii-CCMP3373.AAC.2